MWWRFAWVVDEDATSVTDTPPGEVTAGVDINLMNMQHGLFKRAYQIIGASTDQRITIAANNEATTALQFSALTADIAKNIANNIYYNSPLEIRQNIRNDNMVALCTLSFHDKLKQYFQGKDLESMLSYLENGMEVVKVNGLSFVAVPDWDFMIKKYYDNGTKLKDPHRVLLTTKNNLLFGVPSISDWGEFELWYEKKDKGVYLDIEDKFDTRFGFKNQIMFAV